VDPGRNEKAIRELNNPKITTKVLPRANHSLRKSNDPAKYPDYDWPRIAEGYSEFVKSWIASQVTK
jgi:hypothetical protein